MINAVHNVGHMHNDLSSNNIMFHFFKDESRVSIGVCNSSMTTSQIDPIKTLYTFTFESDMKNALKSQ